MARETTEMICISCPVGCTMQVSHDGTELIEVEGNTCKRGIEYARAELSDPRRMVTSTVKVRGASHTLLPVYTAAPIPKPLIFQLLAELRTVEVQAPVEPGQVILENVLGTGTSILASRRVNSLSM